MRFNDKIPRSFLEYQKKLKPAILAAGIKQAHIYSEIGMSKTTWQRRFRNFDFTAQEVISICKVLNDKKL